MNERAIAADARTTLPEARELAGLARTRIGLKPSLSAPKIEAWLRTLPSDQRPSICKELVASEPDAAAWRSFVESLLVHETYFFRHPDQLRLLADVLLPRLLQARLDAGSHELRIWCAGCSSGEEVYTMALLLQTAIAKSALPIVQVWNPTILGTDLSAATLELARAGSYKLMAGLNSFRDVPDFARHHFAGIFSAAATTWSPSAELRRWTRFEQHNLVRDPPALRDVDLIVCRNTLIYFDEAQVQAALASLVAGLRPAGGLLLGPAESASEDAGLRMVCTEQAVYWTKEAAP
jgi:chemotaxis protein methyltransferase CheR